MPFYMCLASFFFFFPKFLRVDQDKDKDCSLDCGGSSQKPLCASDGRTFLSRCEFQRAKCKDPQLEIAYRGNCRDVSRCVAERKYTQEQARKELQQVFIPECNDDGTYSQVQCHSYTGYCWCVTPNGRPVSGTAVAHKTPRCPGSINEKLPQREGTGKTDDASAPALETQPQGDEEDIASRYPTLWTEQVKSRQNKTNKNSGEEKRIMRREPLNASGNSPGSVPTRVVLSSVPELGAARRMHGPESSYSPATTAWIPSVAHKEGVDPESGLCPLPCSGNGGGKQCFLCVVAHTLTSPATTFNDLGLLVDEERRVTSLSVGDSGTLTMALSVGAAQLLEP
nr:SPARC-related modular calcium-binding protein 2 [Vulpes vulpes]